MRVVSNLRIVWPHVVALYVLFHVAGTIISSAPSVDGVMKRSYWKDPTVQGEFTAWSQRLQGWGVDIDAAELEARAWRMAESWSRVHSIAKSPFRLYQRYTGTRQSWRMFVAPHRYPTRLHVDMRTVGGEWTPLYVRGSDVFTWRGHQLDHIRMRSLLFQYFWNRSPRDYDQFVHWLAERAAEDHPNAAEIRVRTYKFQTLSPDEVRSGRQPSGSFTRSTTLSAEGLR